SHRLRGSVQARTIPTRVSPARAAGEETRRTGASVDSVISGRYAVQMSTLRFPTALSHVRRTYGSAPGSARLNVLGRFLSCPFLRVLDYVPRGGRLLDLGAGHGIFAHLALERGAREAVAVEPDVRKVFLV